MADRIYIGQQAEEYHSSPAIVYSRVTIEVGTDENGNILSYTAGNDTAKELVVQCPWGTQAMANALLASLNGHQYTPFGVTSSNIHPAAELGDEVEVGEGIYSAICERHIDFQTEPVTDVSAPMEEEIDDEDEYENPIRRELTRKIINDTNAVKATLTIQIGQIQLEVAGKINGQQAQSLIDQTINGITLSVTDGTQANTSKFIISGTGISAVSDNIDLKANSINLSTANVTGKLRAGLLATNAVQSENYVGGWTLLYDGSDGIDHDEAYYNFNIGGTWYRIAGEPCGPADGSYDRGYVINSSKTICRQYTISTGAIIAVDEPVTVVTDAEYDELPLSESYGLAFSGTFLDLANGDFHSASLDITEDGAKYKGALNGCKLKDCEGYNESYEATYNGSSSFTFYEEDYRRSRYAGDNHNFIYVQDDTDHPGWYDENNNLLTTAQMQNIGLYVTGTDEADVIVVNYSSGYSKVITMQDLRDLGLIT